MECITNCTIRSDYCELSLEELITRSEDMLHNYINGKFTQFEMTVYKDSIEYLCNRIINLKEALNGS